MNTMPIQRLFVVVVGVAMLSSACVTPIGVTRGSTQEMHHALTANVLSAGQPSSWSAQVLQRNNLFERFNADPEKTLGELRKLLTQRVGGALTRPAVRSSGAVVSSCRAIR